VTLPTTILADDHSIIVDGLRSLLRGHANVIATCSNGRDLLEQTLRLHPALVITDMSMPGMSGLEYLRATRSAGFQPRVIVLSMYGDDDLVSEAFHAGAMAYLPKIAAGEELIDAIGAVMSGRPYASHLVTVQPSKAATRTASKDAAKLSRRQQEVLELIAAGRTMKEAAALLHLSRRTVEMHKYEMMRTLRLKTTAALIQYYVRREQFAEPPNGATVEPQNPEAPDPGL
jgi:DNA-binding NarL/FixJ family response regulator